MGEKGVKMAQPDTNNQILETRRKQAADAKELLALFNKADADGSQTLSQGEFEICIGKPEFKEFLQTRGIDIKEARTFFNMVADTIGDRELDVSHVVRCCLGIKGFATSIDLHILRYEVSEAMSMLLARFLLQLSCLFPSVSSSSSLLPCENNKRG